MAIATKQNKVKPEIFQKLVKLARLDDIALRSMEVQCLMNPYSIDSSKTTINIETDVSVSKSDNELYCFVNYKVSGDENDERKFFVNVCFCAMYTVEKLSDFSDDVISFFASNNAVFNTYSFARETVHSSMQKMLIPPFLMPLLKPENIQKAGPEE
jgi:preprotein translocase subunit SecB